jgi:hypothetical protein
MLPTAAPTTEDLDSLTDDERRSLDVYKRMHGYMKIAPVKVRVNPEFYSLIENGWHETYSALFDKPDEPFVERLAPHHSEAIEWHWNARLALLRGEKPDYWAYFPIWSRGHMKSTVARRIVIVDALLTVAFHQPGYILYVSRNATMAEKHAQSIETMLSAERVRHYCPQLSQVKQSQVTGKSKGWKATFLNTAANVVFHFGGLEEGLAGGNVDDVRPTLILPDDVDGREKSPVIGENRFQKLTTEILPMRQANTLTFWAQNLISRYTAMYRIQSGRSRVLTNRKPTKPIPALLNPVYGEKTVDGVVKDVIISGTPTWEWYGLDRCQEEIDTIGLEAFKQECQHDVDQSNEGLIHKNYNDNVHVISITEFQRKFGIRGMPPAWAKWIINDWARTKTDKHANVAAWVTISSQNSPLPGFTFVFYPMSFKPNAEAEDAAERFLSCLSRYAFDQVTWARVRRDSLLQVNSHLYSHQRQEQIEFERGHLQTVMPRYVRPLLENFNVVRGVMGHSDDTIIDIYNRVYGMNFIGINPGKYGGLDEFNRQMKVDYEMPHPFRPEQKGYTRFFIVVPDEIPNEPKPRLYRDEISSEHLYDSDLLRFQLANRRYREPKLTEAGEQVDEPLKAFDDFGQAFQMLYYSGELRNAPLNEKEQIAQHMSPKTRELMNKTTLTMGEQLALEDEYRDAAARVRASSNLFMDSAGIGDHNFGETCSPFESPLNDVNGFSDIYD